MATKTAAAKTATNLRELANYIENNLTQSQIDMEEYFRDMAAAEVVGMEDLNVVSKYDCNTVACALGHSVAIFPVEDHHFEYGTFDMALFGFDHFPALYMEQVSWPPIENLHWSDVFSSLLDPDKHLVTQRLRNKANELNELNN